MIRVFVITEGPTEESFIKEVVAPTLWERHVYLTPVIVGVPGHKGGNVNYARVKNDVLLQLKQDHLAYCSTMFDLYGLGKGFPGTPLPPNLSGLDKAGRIESAVHQDVVSELGDKYRSDVRFIPYLQVHEYEGLLFSDPSKFSAALGLHSLAKKLADIRKPYETPEDINDGPNTAPSKRVVSLYPGYNKVIDGTLAAQAVGLAAMRKECPHFDAWITRLESLAP